MGCTCTAPFNTHGLIYYINVTYEIIMLSILLKYKACVTQGIYIQF